MKSKVIAKLIIVLIMVLKMLLLVAPLLTILIGELFSSMDQLSQRFANGFWITVVFLSLAIVILLSLYAFKETKRTKVLKLIFLITSSLYFIIGGIYSFLYLGFGIAFGMSTWQSVYIPATFTLIVAAAIFFTTESIKQIKSPKKKEGSENEKD